MTDLENALARIAALEKQLETLYNFLRNNGVVQALGALFDHFGPPASFPHGNPSDFAHMDALAEQAKNGDHEAAAYLAGIAAGQELPSGPGTAWPWNSPSVNWGENDSGRQAEREYAAKLIAA